MNSDLFNTNISNSQISDTKFQDVEFINQKENMFLLKPANLIGLKVNSIDFNDESIYTSKTNINNIAYIESDDMAKSKTLKIYVVQRNQLVQYY